MKLSWVMKNHKAHTMTFTNALGWINDDAEYAIRATMNLSGNESVTDIPGIGPSLAYRMENAFRIMTVNDIVGYVLYHGFPNNDIITLNDESKFMISLLCAKRVKAIDTK